MKTEPAEDEVGGAVEEGEVAEVAEEDEVVDETRLLMQAAEGVKGGAEEGVLLLVMLAGILPRNPSRHRNATEKKELTRTRFLRPTASSSQRY